MKEQSDWDLFGTVAVRAGGYVGTPAAMLALYLTESILAFVLFGLASCFGTMMLVLKHARSRDVAITLTNALHPWVQGLLKILSYLAVFLRMFGRR